MAIIEVIEPVKAIRDGQRQWKVKAYVNAGVSFDAFMTLSEIMDIIQASHFVDQPSSLPGKIIRSRLGVKKSLWMQLDSQEMSGLTEPGRHK